MVGKDATALGTKLSALTIALVLAACSSPRSLPIRDDAGSAADVTDVQLADLALDLYGITGDDCFVSQKGFDGLAYAIEPDAALGPADRAAMRSPGPWRAFAWRSRGAAAAYEQLYLEADQRRRRHPFGGECHAASASPVRAAVINRPSRTAPRARTRPAATPRTGP